MGNLDYKSTPGSSNESSPLMVATRAADSRGGRPRVGADESSKNALYMFLLTLSIGGLQIVWSVELSNGSPYLLSLGMSKSLLAFKRQLPTRVGKRKPFMVVGGAATIVSLLALAWVKELVGGFLSIFGVESTSAGAKIVIIIMATIFMYCLDFAINTGVHFVQAAIRAFIVDNCPAHQQELSNAWASRMVGVGNILGYIFGYMDLPKIVPFLGNTQFKVLCVIASVFLSATLAISCVYIKERNPKETGLFPRVCQVQIAAWVGWFPFLYYSTTYVGQLYVNPVFADNPHLSEGEVDKAWEDATRVGTLALLIYAIISFLANMLLPLFVVPLYGPAPDTASQRDSLDGDLDDDAEPAARRLSFSSMPTGNASEPLLDAVPVERETEGKPTWLSRLRIPGLTLPRVWLLSHLLFAACMFSTFFIYSHQAGSAFVGFVGVSWAVALWAPFALIAAEVARIDPSRHSHRRTAHSDYNEHEGEAQDGGPGEYNSVGGGDVEHGHPKHHNDGGDVAQAGIILGLHNMAISLPQILSSLVCSAIFKASQKQRGEPWDDSVGWVLRFGGCAALVAAWLTRRVSDGSR
ncbi:Major facilitator superfamily domain general substrate transporter [Penicillium expansum]|nr:Major facilitator superfamily domain general substrate transporter [Penicillium expansum]